MTLKIYVDRISQPGRAVILFCKLNGIDFEEVYIDLSKRHHYSRGYREISPMRKIPAITDGEFNLSESHAILRYLACAFPGIADHWYPADLQKRAKVDSLLDWHNSSVCPGPTGYVVNYVLAPALQLPLNPQVAAETEKLFLAYLAMIESVWLQEGRFLLGSDQPSIADISVLCEIMQLMVLDDKDIERILGPHKRILKWIDDVKNAMEPHFQEVNSILYEIKENLQKQKYPLVSSITKPSAKPVLPSKM